MVSTAARVLRQLALTLVASACLSSCPVLAQDAEGEGERVNRIARIAALQFLQAQTEEGVPDAVTLGPQVSLTLDEAVARALDRNLELTVERLNPQTFDWQVASLQAAYRPTATSVFGQRSVAQPPTNQLNGGTIVQNDNLTFSPGVGQALPWGGGDVSLQFNNDKQVTSNIFANFNPTYNSNVTVTLSQPLLRGFLIDTVRQQLRVTAINRDISEIQVRGVIATTLAAVRSSYWELVFAVEAAEVARGSLALAQTLVDDNRARVALGAMAPADVVQAEAEVATRRQVVAQAEAAWRSAELALKRLLVESTDDSLWRARINPSDRPTFVRQPVDVEDAVRRALSGRTDLAQARRTLEGNDVTIRFMRNETLPAVNLEASYASQGLGGTQFVRQGSGLGSTVIGTIPGGYGDAWRSLTSGSYPTWNLALNVSYPIGSGVADAQYARARVQRSQTTAQLRAMELQVATEVTNAAFQVESGAARYEAAAAATALAQSRLEAEQSRFDVGLSTNFFVVQAQRDLLTARNSELRALLDHRRSLVDFARVQESPAVRGGGVTAIN